METSLQPLEIAIGVMLLLTLAVLFLGIGSMAKGGASHARFGNNMMRLRVICQFVAVALIALLAYLRLG